MIKTFTLHNNDTTLRYNEVEPTHELHSIVSWCCVIVVYTWTPLHCVLVLCHCCIHMDSTLLCLGVVSLLYSVSVKITPHIYNGVIRVIRVI
jgi:hypothetical protein